MESLVIIFVLAVVAAVAFAAGRKTKGTGKSVREETVNKDKIK